MIRNINRHLFLKYTYSFNGTDIVSMDEHVKVDIERNNVIWGQFTGDSRSNNFDVNKIKVLDKQVNKGIPTFVFFFCGEKKELYVAQYLERYSRYEIEEASEEMKLIPQYYHHLVGKRPDGNPSCKAYVKVRNIMQIDINSLRNIIQFDKDRTMFDRASERFNTAYVNVEDSFYNELVRLTQKNIKITVDQNTLNKLEEIRYQNDIESVRVDEIINFHDNPKIIDDKKSRQETLKWDRNPKRAKRVIVYNNYKCEFDKTHNYFISDITKKNYVEAHHLIPMEFQDRFIPISLDVEANIISLCVVCHKKLHHGIFSEKKKIIEKLYTERKNRIKDCGINIELDELLNLYK